MDHVVPCIYRTQYCVIVDEQLLKEQWQGNKTIKMFEWKWKVLYKIWGFLDWKTRQNTYWFVFFCAFFKLWQAFVGESKRSTIKKRYNVPMSLVP